MELFDAAGFYAYHLAEHHTPAVHSLAPSQNVFLAAPHGVPTRSSSVRASIEFIPINLRVSVEPSESRFTVKVLYTPAPQAQEARET